MIMSENWTVKNIPGLSGKTIVITGANSGIGFEASRELARAGALVILASRSQAKAEGAIQKIRKEIPSARLEFIRLDLASLGSVRQFAEEFKSKHDRLHILLNNAGIMLVPYGLTEDGFEKTVGTNHLGHFALTGLLIDRLTGTPGSRVVNVSSNAHYGGEMDFNNLLFQENRDYTPMKAYSRSKLANLLFTYELQRRFLAEGVDALALAAHPGISATGLADHLLNHRMTWLIQSLMKIMYQSSTMGALPILRAATDSGATGGEYYGPDGKGERSGFPVVVQSNPDSKNLADAHKLWEISQELTGVSFLH
jgi:NAD(P)-dependent dehydrogenase (short-subunit alcohol dehydrogenase family)